MKKNIIHYFQWLSSESAIWFVNNQEKNWSLLSVFFAIIKGCNEEKKIAMVGVKQKRYPSE